jgi:hypothetical protein
MNVSANISAMHAAAYSFNTSAHNVANIATENFDSIETVQTEGVDGGPYASSYRSDSSADISTEMLKQKRLMYDFKANAKVVGLQDQLVGNLIDILA